MRKAAVRCKADERILGDSGFVSRVLKASEDRLERRYALRANGYDFGMVVAQVARALDMDPGAVLGRGKQPRTVKARSLLCYWANRELGMSIVELSHRLRMPHA